MTNKICRNCKHASRSDYGFHLYEGDRWYCTATQEKVYDVVTGETHTIKTHKCYDMRAAGTECGPEGKLFEDIASATKAA